MATKDEMKNIAYHRCKQWIKEENIFGVEFKNGAKIHFSDGYCILINEDNVRCEVKYDDDDRVSYDADNMCACIVIYLDYGHGLYLRHVLRAFDPEEILT
jgi:hypothetical protein